jgi:hypothetical protein
MKNEQIDCCIFLAEFCWISSEMYGFESGNSKQTSKLIKVTHTKAGLLPGGLTK